MIQYRINPYISFVESYLVSEFVEYAVFHRLSGELFSPSDRARTFFQALKLQNQISLGEADILRLGDFGNEIQKFIQREFLISEDNEPLKPFVDQYVTRPIQNPALIYRSNAGEWILVRTSMLQTIYSPQLDELPEVIEETLSELAANILLLADGTRTLREIFSTVSERPEGEILEDTEFRTALDFLTTQERQLIKFTSRQDDLDEPYEAVNIVPRNLYHSDRWHDRSHTSDSTESIVDFHLHGIEDADWEFDLIEPTVNHCFRFPHAALGGLDYGSKFSVSTLRPDVVPLLDQVSELNVLEVGGGRGSFARSFIEQSGTSGHHLNYHILDLSPTLMGSQRKILSNLLPESRHFHQDATEFDLPDLKFDLIISNEVIADFPVASVERKKADAGTGNGSGQTWQGEGAAFVEKYDLADLNAPDSFLVNAGAFRFIERAWKHLTPGGTFIVTEYGSEHHHPARSFNLNHDEFTIHFGHLAACAAKVGFETRLLTLKDFLGFDGEQLVLNGREEHILCLNHVLKNHGVTLPYAVISKSDFDTQCRSVAEATTLSGFSFSPLKTGYHFGPNIIDFFVLIMNKPR